MKPTFGCTNKDTSLNRPDCVSSRNIREIVNTQTHHWTKKEYIMALWDNIHTKCYYITVIIIWNRNKGMYYNYYNQQ